MREKRRRVLPEGLSEEEKKKSGVEHLFYAHD